MIDRYNRDINKIAISLGSDAILSNEDIKFAVKSLCNLGINIIELDIEGDIDRLNIYDLIYYFKSECRVETIGIVSDGFGIKNKVDKLKSYGLTDISIRLESLKQYKYKQLNHNININEVLETLEKCITANINTKIICTLINDFNVDEMLDFINLSKSLPIEVSFAELIPDASCMKFFKQGYVNIQNILNNADSLQGKNYVNKRYRYYKLSDSNGLISIDTHNDFNVCKGCNEIILDINGYLKTCIHANSGIDIKNYINKPLMFKEVVKQAIYTKDRNNIEGGARYI